MTGPCGAGPCGPLRPPGGTRGVLWAGARRTTGPAPRGRALPRPHLRMLGCLAAQWQQPPPSAKPKRVRPSASRYAALSDQGLDIRAAFQPEAGPSALALSPGLVESEDL